MHRDGVAIHEKPRILQTLAQRVNERRRVTRLTA